MARGRGRLTKRHSRNLSGSRMSAVRCYDCPTRRCETEAERNKQCAKHRETDEWSHIASLQSVTNYNQIPEFFWGGGSDQDELA